MLPARDLKKAEILKEFIQKETPMAQIILLEIDLSSFASIQRFSAEFLSLQLPLHILMYVFYFIFFSKKKFKKNILTDDWFEFLSYRNNAGKFSQKLEFSEDKIEMTFATNYLGNYL